MRFFIDSPITEKVALIGEDARHIAKVLRLRPGDGITLCDMRGTDYAAVIEAVETGAVTTRVTGSNPSKGEAAVRLRLYQALPKSDKMDGIVQKSVELGVHEIIPVLTHRCVARPDKASIPKKWERWQRIAYEAAKQSGRGMVPQILPLMEYKSAIGAMAGEGGILLYENSIAPLSAVLGNRAGAKRISLMIGPEGGFEPSEIELARGLGVADASLGKRILRCETAPIAALTCVMVCFGEL